MHIRFWGTQNCYAISTLRGMQYAYIIFLWPTSSTQMFMQYGRLCIMRVMQNERYDCILSKELSACRVTSKKLTPFEKCLWCNANPENATFWQTSLASWLLLDLLTTKFLPTRVSDVCWRPEENLGLYYSYSDLLQFLEDNSGTATDSKYVRISENISK